MAAFRLRTHVEWLLQRAEFVAHTYPSGRLQRRANRGVRGLAMRAFRRGRWASDLGAAIASFAGAP